MCLPNVAVLAVVANSIGLIDLPQSGPVVEALGLLACGCATKAKMQPVQKLELLECISFSLRGLN
jgi:hypothetical protein